ncbi:hypothetical protein GCK72_018955 [Caenorhabditis remanei]|uniref:CHK kinase-like domain-containing protein n=1 Tax=Caenorhabditis remanei TaxID=31234 RepID=A0A6A5GBE8_CAERE|nr:hypothetical protein GCK72_018955 [Caenorhabditis remanei]KAF1752400.1 hypothetical protein GCK72_018955 [Caenorhabditis remanei]
MSLYKLADGILETHVTWRDVEEKLQKKFGTKAAFGEKKTARNISDLKGFMSKIALIEPNWQNIENDKILPNKFAVKISSQLPFLEYSKVLKITDENGYDDQKLTFLGKILREAHNREVETYKLLERFNHPDVPYTKIYAMKSFSDESDLKGYILMKYIPDIHITSMSEHISADDLIPVIRGVATFAALGHNLSDSEKQFVLGPEFLEYYFNTFLDPTSLESTFEHLRVAFSFLESSETDKLFKIYRHYIQNVNKFTRISDLVGLPLIFNHGDLWQSNILYKTENRGKLKLKAIIDWQALSLLPPGFDMARLFMGSLSPEDRRQRTSELLMIYHETFTQSLGMELFSHQEIIDSYNLHFPLMSLMVLPGLTPFLDASHLYEPEKSEVREKTKRNMQAIIEDVFEKHEYNMENYADFMKK